MGNEIDCWGHHWGKESILARFWNRLGPRPQPREYHAGGLRGIEAIIEEQTVNIGFVAAVAEMRALQKTWFNTKPDDRPPDLLRQCKEAEKRVDKAVERYTNPETFLFEK